MSLPTQDQRREAALKEQYPEEHARYLREAPGISFAQWLMKNPPRATMERPGPVRSLGRDGGR